MIYHQRLSEYMPMLYPVLNAKTNPLNILFPKNPFCMLGGDNIGSLVYTVAEVAQLLGISRTSAYTFCKNGVIPSMQLGKRIIIPISRFNDWFEKGAF